MKQPDWRCPLCGGHVARVSGAVAEPVMGVMRDGSDSGRRVVRPAVFFACSECEYCSELGPSLPRRNVVVVDVQGGVQ